MKRHILLSIGLALISLSASAGFEDGFRIAKLYPFYTDVKAEWEADSEADSYEVVCGDRTLVVMSPRVHISGLKMDSDFTISITKIKGGRRGGSASASFRTGYVRPLFTSHDVNLGASHVTVEFSDVSGSSMFEWPCLGEAYQMELYSSPNTASQPVYSLYSYDSQLTGVGIFCISSLAGMSVGKAIDHPLRMSFGRLSPGTSYWVRVRTVGGVELKNCYVKKLDDKGHDMASKREFDPTSSVLASPKGYSDWSELVELSTLPAHVPSENEVLYEGFDAISFGPDYFNVARGIVTTYKQRASSMTMRNLLPDSNPFAWEGEWGACGLSVDFPLAEWNAVKRAKYVNGQTSVTTTIGINYNTLVFPKEAGSLANWSVSWWASPAMGVMRLQGSATNKGAASFVATPELVKGISKKGSRCLLTFKLCPYKQIAPDRIRIELYNSDEDVMQYVGPVVFDNIITDKDNYSFVEANSWQQVEVELTIHPYDGILIYNDSASSIMIDDICVTRL